MLIRTVMGIAIGIAGIAMGIASGIASGIAIGAAIIAALSQIGVDIRVLLAILAAGALAIGIGLSGPVSSLIAGGILFSRRPFRAGDTVTLAGCCCSWFSDCSAAEV